ncbi:ornithine cyclodeaminase family protein [Sphingorhabdus sp. 109]|jgi:ornithine cyclodeaminase|uniref:ornithine cyclodeaminase family protein n=1 Tax=Sphingorhabdus sp. 109 TaxID=2653173 RepID=UPI0012F1CF68|nr:ornithine cyclodeaminase family protein [Sphingorhabdus sp. 109]VWX60358.1 Ornithine cyclodeaminase [Sphingorhabdus sp. 109]
MRIITRSDVERLLPVAACVDVMRSAMQETSRGNATLPIRQFIPIPHAPGKLAVMPGTLGAPACFGIKLVCKYDRPHGDPLGTHVGMVMLFDSDKGIPLAMIEGSSLTAIRTSAASALATDVLAREDARRVAIIGNGEQAMRHSHAMRAVRKIEHFTVWGRDAARTEAFAARVYRETGVETAAAATVEAAVAEADIICTATSAKQPILFGRHLKSGQHINLVGAAIPSAAEADDEAVARSRFYVDYQDAAMAAAGELLGAISRGAVQDNHIVGEIGNVIDGTAPGRSNGDEITIYKSLGVASQDLAAAHAIWTMAETENSGASIDLLD